MNECYNIVVVVKVATNEGAEAELVHPVRNKTLNISGGWENQLETRLWIEKTNVLVDNEDDISRNLKSLGATEIANAVRKKSLAGIETAIRFFETQPRRERDPDR